MKLLVLGALKFFAQSIIQKHKPFVIGITGSVGKTTTRHFITSFLEKKGADFYTPEGNYNGEFGLPLSIIQARSGGKNPLAWIGVFGKAVFQMYRRKYPKILVLEYGIDRIGEMDFMCDIVEPDICIFTVLSANHISQFGTADIYFEEKRQLTRQKKKNARLIITNADDKEQDQIRHTDTYGQSAAASLKINTVHHTQKGISISFILDGESFELQTSIFGAHNTTTLSPAILALRGLGYDVAEILSFFGAVHLPMGRGNTLIGTNQSLIIDSTYNGGYASIVAGLSMLADLGKQLEKKTVAIIGDMRELGPLEESRHQDLAHFCKTLPIDQFIFVGPLCMRYIQPLFPTASYSLDARKAGQWAHDFIQGNHTNSVLVFAKGSQNTIFLEESLKEIVLPEEQSKLVRQSRRWQMTKKKFFEQI